MIDIWWLPLPLSPERSASFRLWLAPDEQSRFADFQHAAAAERFLAGRGLARQAVSSLSGENPADIRFAVSAQGKPFLPSSPLAFSLAHTSKLVCVACGNVGRLGIDVENLDRPLQADSIVNRYFTPGERARWASLPLESRSMAFFRIWTRKEAFLKGTGEGIAGLSRVEVSEAPGEPRALRAYDGDSKIAADWWFAECEPEPGFLVNVAVEGPVSGVQWHRL